MAFWNRSSKSRDSQIPWSRSEGYYDWYSVYAEAGLDLSGISRDDWEQHLDDLAWRVRQGSASVDELEARIAAVAIQLRQQIDLRQAMWRNCQAWIDRGAPVRWVDEHRGSWNHQDWLGLLNSVKAGPFWPMNES